MTNDSVLSSLRLLYDQHSPVGNFANGAHYSVVRAVVWLDTEGPANGRASFHDIAIVWDSDHDRRLFAVLEKIYFAGLLPPIRFIGERKGTLSIIVAPDALASMDIPDLDGYRQRLIECAEVDGDVWYVEVSDDPSSSNILHTSPSAAATYLAAIDLMWNLGTKLAMTDA